MENETIATIIGVILGFGLSWLSDLCKLRKKHLAYWAAIGVEVEFGSSRAQMFIDDKISAPLYRLPTKAFENCYPELLSDGKLSEEDSMAIMAFFSEVETFNRGLELATVAKNEANSTDEYRRNLIKAERLTKQSQTYIAVNAVINSYRKK